jgi:hypothetical protein
MAVYPPILRATDTPPSESPLYQTPKIPCGSGLARECSLSVTWRLTDPPYSRASPLPQLISVVDEIAFQVQPSRRASSSGQDGQHRFTVGAGLPAMAVYPPILRATDTPLPESPLYQTPKIPCGSGLARECSLSDTWRLTDPPPSRASPLPQLISVVDEIAFQVQPSRRANASGQDGQHSSPVGAGLPAMAVYPPTLRATDTPPPESPLYQTPKIPCGS